MVELKGQGVSPGYAIAKACVLTGYEQNMVEPLGSGIDCYRKAKEQAISQLQTLSEKDDERGLILKAQLCMLKDPVVEEEMVSSLNSCGPKEAVKRVYGAYEKVLQESKDPLMKERSSDIRDVKKRLLRCIDKVEDVDLSLIQEPVILCAYDLLPSQTANLDKNKIIGIVTTVGGSTSHNAIIARYLGICCLTSVDISSIVNDQWLAIDAQDSKLYIDPTEAVKDEIVKKYQALKNSCEDLSIYNSRKAITKDYHRVLVKLNLGLDNQQLPYMDCDGVGLLRTELLCMSNSKIRNKKSQEKAYGYILDYFNPRPVTIRTLDIGGDKKLDYADSDMEENPFLGQRGIRLCLANKALFEPQIEALLKSSYKGRLKIMLPMVATIEDIQEAKAVIDQVSQRLERVFDYELGVMIEVPSAAIMASEIAKEVDFASIGTNDLIQYTHAADRLNPKVNSYYQTYSPPVIRLIDFVVKAFQKEGKSISVCGEMASNPDLALVLVGLGVNELSVNPTSVNMIKKTIIQSNFADLKKLAQRVLLAPDQPSVIELINEYKTR